VPKELRTAELHFEVVKNYGEMLKNVPEEFKTAEMCLEAVKNFGLALECVPEKFKTAELCLEAVKQEGCALEFVPENLKTAEMCLEAVKEERYALRYVPENLKTAEMCNVAAVKQIKIAPRVMSSFTDQRDGKVYKTVKIGSQIWMAENLDYDAPGSKSYVNNETKFRIRFYDWKTAMKACPPGWHLPNEEEWETLVDFVGGHEIAGEKLKAKSGWSDYEGKSGNGTDDFGFAALPSGRCNSDGYHNYVDVSFWWSSASEKDAYEAYSRCMDYRRADARRYYANKSRYFFCVRCVKNSKKVKKAVKQGGKK